MPDANIVYRYTSIGRTLDPRYPTNVLILVLALVGGLAGGALALIGGRDLGSAFVAGLWAAVATFLAWVITRDIDPDYPYSAFASAGVALVACLLLGEPRLDLLALIGVSVSLRLISRVVGPACRWTDSVGILVVALVLAVTGHGLESVMMGIAFALDGLMLPPLRRHLGFAAIAVVAGVLALIAEPVTVVRPEGATANVLFAIVLAFGFLLITTHHVTSPCDVAGYELSAARVQAAMVWLLAAAVIVGFTAGAEALTGFLPVWAALAGAALYRAGHMALKSVRESKQGAQD
ncbi:MAG: hypothetical protein U0452_09315 [Anaerolineae bacterium]